MALCAAGAVIAPGWACAQDAELDPYALSPEQLFGATVISASRTPEALWDAPAALYVISSDDIARSGAASIPEALRLAPGVHVARTNTGTWAVSVRGFNAALANKLLVLVDGREVYDPLFSGVYWDIQDTAIEDIDRIEIVRGPGASLWGANAVNGVINIITKRAADTQGALISAAAGNVQRAVITARYGGSAGETHWRVFGRYFDRAALGTVGGGDANGAWQAWRGGFRVDAGDAFTLQGEAYTSNTGQLRAVPQLTAPYAQLIREDISADGVHLLGRWTQELDGEARFTLQAYLDYAHRDQFSLEDKRTTLDLDAQYEFASSPTHDAVAGVRYRHTQVDLEFSPLIFAAGDELSEDLFSAFVQDRITLAPEQLYLTLGSKFDQNEFTGFEVQPTARLQWHGGETHTLWASVSRAVRTPSELEHDLNVVAGVIPPGIFPIPVSVQPTASPSFESEELIAYEIGYRRNWTPTLATDLALFVNKYEGLQTLTLQTPTIGANPLHIILPIAYANGTDGQAQGFEAVLEWQAREDLQLTASWSFLDLELHGPAPAVAIDSELAQETSPRNLVTLRAQWNGGERWSADAILHYVDELPGFGLDAFTRLDARIGYRLTETMELELIGQGLTQEAQVEFGDPNNPYAAAVDRSLYARLVWRR